MLASFDIKFIGRDQKQCRKGEACHAFSQFVWSSLINLISKDTEVVFYLHHYKTSWHKEHQRSENKRSFCPNLLTSRMPYDINR